VIKKDERVIRNIGRKKMPSALWAYFQKEGLICEFQKNAQKKIKTI